MFNKHLFKILSGFVAIIALGLVGLFLVNSYQENNSVEARARLPDGQARQIE